MKVNIALLTVTDTRTIDNDKSGGILVNKIKEANHNLLDRKICKDNNIEFLKIPLSIIGILYLLYLAYDSFQSSNLKNEKIELNNKYDQNALLSGVILSITNPQNIFYWAALGSAFGALGIKEPTTYHYFIFFLGFISSSIIWCFICALAVEKIFRFTNSLIKKYIFRICSLVFIYLAFGTLYSLI